MDAFKKIVIIEDDAESCNLFESALPEASENATLKCYPNVIDFMNEVTATQSVPDLIFIEINLQKINGFAAAELFSRHALLVKVPLIVFSNSRVPEDMERLFKLGVARYIVKPGKYNDMVGVLKKVGRHTRDDVWASTPKDFLLSVNH